MIDIAIREQIIALFRTGASTGQVLARYPYISKSTIYNFRSLAKVPNSGLPGNNEVVGVIGDTHEPFCHPRYREFVKDTFDQYHVSKVIHIGDLVDNYAMSYYESDPDGSSAGDEWLRAMESVAKWWETFPEGILISGNHDNIPARRVKSAGLTKRILRENIYDMPEGWINREEVIINDVHYSHGIGMAGCNGHRNNAIAKGMSSVIGHCHSFGGISYVANPYKIMFGMNVGCGLDIEAYAMEYGKYFPRRPTLGCGIVFSRKRAMFVPMDLTKYSRHGK